MQVRYMRSLTKDICLLFAETLNRPTCGNAEFYKVMIIKNGF